MNLKLVGSALLCAVVGCRTAPPAPAPTPEPADRSSQRERWFFEQRAYPFGEVPVNGRRVAFEEATRTRVAENEAAMTSSAGWRPVGPQPVETRWPWGAATGRVKALAVSPADSNLVLAGSSSGGIWRSTDGGAQFAPVSDDQVDLAVGAIAFAPSDPNVVYAAMGNDFLGTGVLRSDDGGAHWMRVDGPSYRARGTARGIAVDPADWRRVWVAQWSRLDETSGSHFSSGVHFSADGGVTWSRQLSALPNDLAATSVRNTLLVAASRIDAPDEGASGIYGTTNGGITWSLLFRPSTSGAFSFITIGASPSRIYAHCVVFGSTTLYRMIASNDGGLTWTDLPAVDLPRESTLFTRVDPSNPDIVYVGMRDLYKSTDGGQTFVNMTNGYTPTGTFDPAHSYAHVDQHAFALDPADSRRLFLGNDGGVYRSANGADTLESLSRTLSLVQAYGIAAHPTDPARLYLGTQDNGMERRNAAGTWHELITGDYGSIVFDANNPETLATNYVRGEIFSFVAGGLFFRDTVATNATFGEEASQRIAFIAPFEHQRLNNTLYFGTWRLFLSRDFGRAWSAPAGMLDLTKGGGDTLSAIGLSSTSPNAIYTGSGRGRVMTTRDEGITWIDVTGSLPPRSVRAIAVDPANPDVAYVGVSGYATAHVWSTANGGASWQQHSAGLPDVPVNALLLQGNVLYAGTDIGVFRLTGDTWQYFSNGMPPVIVTDFAVTAAGNIVAATHGRGAYELTIATSPKRRGVRH